MLAGADGLPNPANIQSFVGVDATGEAAGHTVDLKIGPGGDLFYVDIEGGTLHRITYTAANQPPTARISANPVTGAAPLTVAFDGPGFHRPRGPPAHLFLGPGRRRHVRGRGQSHDHLHQQWHLHRVAAGHRRPGRNRHASVTITVGNTAPAAVIDAPSATLTWQVGQMINFSGHATDAQDGTLPPSALTWSVILRHCSTPTDCHTHLIQTFEGVASSRQPPTPRTQPLTANAD
jgi:hypothetical protein